MRHVSVALGPGFAAVALAAIGSPAAAQDQYLVPGRSPDAKLSIGGEYQFRYTFSRESSPVRPGDEVASGFSFRRLRLRLRGSPDGGRTTLFFQTEANSGEARLLDLFIEGTLADGLKLGGGQFVLPFSHEQSVVNFKLQGPEYSSVVFSVNPTALLRTQGVMLTATDGPSRAFLALTDGTDALNAGPLDPGEGEAVTLRAEHALLGELAMFNQFTAPRGTPAGLLVGAAAHAERRDAGGDRFAWTADLTFKNDGFNAALAGFGHAAEDLTLGPAPQPEHVYGLVAQAGVYVTDDVEPFARYQWGTTSDGAQPDLSLIEAGCNVYLAGHAVRFSGDVGYAFERVGPVFQRPIDGLRASGNGSPGEVVVRLQMQLLF